MVGISVDVMFALLLVDLVRLWCWLIDCRGVVSCLECFGVCDLGLGWCVFCWVLWFKLCFRFGLGLLRSWTRLVCYCIAGVCLLCGFHV